MASKDFASLYRDATSREIDMMIADDRYVAEPKLDGVRCVVRVSAGRTELLNRRGVPLAAGKASVRAEIAKAFDGLGLIGDWLFDGELVGSTLWLFDLVKGGQASLASEPYARRAACLRGFFNHVVDLPHNVEIVDMAIGRDAKVAMLEAAKADGAEGIMLKPVDAPYIAGRSDRNGRKVKLVKDVDLIVMSLAFEGRDNAVLGAVMADGTVKEVGRCSTIGKGVVKVGDVVEVRYLYVGANGRLVQPRMMRVRGDKAATECGIDQIAA